MSQHRSIDTDRLLVFARPELYRANAFRVLELPVTANDRAIARRVQEIELSTKFGGGTDTDLEALALDPRPDTEGIREAAHRLKDPETRILDEFFWPRISNLLGHTLRKSDNQAIRIWLEEDSSEAPNGQGKSLHNLAVLTHLRVLDLELLASKQPLGESVVRYRDAAWDNAYRYWYQLLSRDAFWQALSERIRQLGDPRLTTYFASELRGSLPSIILTINAELAVRAVEAGQSDDANRHALIIQTSEFDEQDIDRVLRRATLPVRQRLNLLCSSAEAESEAQPSNAKRATAELLAGARPLLSVFETLFLEENLVSGDAFDHVVRTAKNCLYEYGKETKDWKGMLPLLEELSRLAASDSLLSQIEETLSIVRSNEEFRQAGPLFRRIKMIMESGKRPEEKFSEIERIVPRVREFALHVSDGSETLGHLSNALAGALRSISVDLHNEAENYGLAYQAVFLAREFGIDPELREIIEADLLLVREHAEKQEIIRDLDPIKSVPALGTTNGIGFTLYGRSDHESKMNSYLTTLYFVVFDFPVFPMGRYRVTDLGNDRYRFLGRAPLRRLDKWHRGVLVAALVVVVGIIVVGSNQNSETGGSRLGTDNSRAPTNTAAPRQGNNPIIATLSPTPLKRQSKSPEPQPSVDNVVHPSRDIHNYEAENLKIEIEQGKSSLARLDSEIDSISDELTSYKTNIDLYASTLKRLKRDQDLGYDVDEDDYNRAVQKHNYYVEVYNTRLSAYREQVSAYKDLQAEVNAKVERYNRIISAGP